MSSTALSPIQSAVIETRQLLDTEAFKKRFNEIMGSRAPLFMASITNYITASPQLADCDRKSIIASAIISATLDLPIEKSLGFAYIVPYGRQAQFQLGYRGLIQLALRSGQYARMKETVINKEAFGGYDDVGEAIIHWDKVDETEEAVGYAFAWRTTNGFTKIVYWTKDHVIKHARKYSKSYGRDSSPWTTNFDAMALKTVIRAGLSKYGIMSIDLQKGIQAEEIAMTTDDAGTLIPVPEAPGEAPEGQMQPPPETASEKLRRKRTPKDVTPRQTGNPPLAETPVATSTLSAETLAAAEKQINPPEIPHDVTTAEPPQAADPEPVAPPASPVETPVAHVELPAGDDDARQGVIDKMQDQMLELGVSEMKLWAYAQKLQGMVPAGVTSVWDLPTAALEKLSKAIKALSVGRTPAAP